MKLLTSRTLITLCLTPLANGATSVNISGPSNGWKALEGNYDYLSDQQTGLASGDIVGINPTDPGFFTSFGDNGSTSNTDGTLAFRMRLDAAGGNKNTPDFDRVAWVGIDADANGSVDVFVGLVKSGSVSQIRIYGPGTDLNTSPSTTSIDSSATFSYSLTSTNYNYRPVNFPTDGGTTNDITGLGDPDYYASFSIPFADLVSYLANRATNKINITDQTSVRYVLATSAQDNALNQDLGGIDDDNSDPDTRWDDPDGGGMTDITTVPEPSSGLLAILPALGLIFSRKRR